MSTNFDSPLAAFFGDLLKDNTAIVEVDNHRVHRKVVIEPVDKQQGILRWESDPSLSFNFDDESDSSDESSAEESLEEQVSRWTSDSVEIYVEDDKDSEEVRRRRTSLTKPKRTCSNEHAQHPEIVEEISKIVASRSRRHSRRPREGSLQNHNRKLASPSTASPQMPLRKSSITADAARMIEDKYHKKGIVAIAC